MEKIILFGGTFNPPHKAHRLIAEKLVSKSNKLFIIPCGSYKLTTKINYVHRLKMIKIAFKNIKAEIIFVL